MDTQPGHAYIEPKNHASKGYQKQMHIGGGGCNAGFTNHQMNDVGHKSMRLGGGGRFAKLAKQTGSPALAAWIGRKKYGAKKMASMSAAGRKKGQ